MFRSDIVAFKPPGYSVAADGEAVPNEIAYRSEVRHCREMGFVSMPDSGVMILPASARG